MGEFSSKQVSFIALEKIQKEILLVLLKIFK